MGCARPDIDPRGQSDHANLCCDQEPMAAIAMRRVRPPVAVILQAFVDQLV